MATVVRIVPLPANTPTLLSRGPKQVFIDISGGSLYVGGPATDNGPQGWLASSLPGGPGFATLELARNEELYAFQTAAVNVKILEVDR